jgi:hypothetical protein
MVKNDKENLELKTIGHSTFFPASAFSPISCLLAFGFLFLRQKKNVLNFFSLNILNTLKELRNKSENCCNGVVSTAKSESPCLFPNSGCC